MAFDLTVDSVKLAIVPTGTEVIDTDFVTAAWSRAAPTTQKVPLHHLSTDHRFIKVSATVVDLANDNTESDFAYVVALLGVEGILTPATGKNDCYVQVTNGSEVVVLTAGTLTVT